VAVGGDGDGAEQLGRELVAEKNCGWSIGAANNADGSGLFRGEAEEVGAEESDEQSKLRRSAEQEGARHRDERAEIGESADAEKDQWWKQLELHSLVNEVVESTLDAVHLERLGLGRSLGRE